MEILLDALATKKYEFGTRVTFYVNGQLEEYRLGEMLWRIWGNRDWRRELQKLVQIDQKNPLILDRIHYYLVDYVTIHFLQEDDIARMMDSLRELKFSIES